MRDDCRDCAQPLVTPTERATGWCRPCASWEFRHEHDDEPETDDDEQS